MVDRNFFYRGRFRHYRDRPPLIPGNRGLTYYSLSDQEAGIIIEDQISGELFHMVLERKFVQGATVLFPDVLDVIVWRAPFDCTVIGVNGYRVGGNAANKINARRNGTDLHLNTDMGLTQADEWRTSTAVQNTAYVTGDKLEIQITNVAAAPSQIAIQVDFSRP